MSDGPDDAPCRRCGKPRGINITEGTRCASCARRDGVIFWGLIVLAAGYWTFFATRDLITAVLASLVAIPVTPLALVGTAFIHEASHALAAWVQGQKVTRIVIGEGTVRWRIGQDPQLVVGSVVIGNGLTTLGTDVDHRGYKLRNGITFMAGPLVSLAVGLSIGASPQWGFAARTGAMIFAYSNLFMAFITLIPKATFGGRVWSDLAATLWIARADRQQIEDFMLDGIRERMAILLQAGLTTKAIETAQQAANAIPSPMASSLVAYALHQSGDHDSAREVASKALSGEADEASRAYLSQFLSDDLGGG